MNSPSYLLSLAVLYVGVLFAVAWLVDRRSEVRRDAASLPWRAPVYALSLAVYCSSWTFYGAVGSTTSSPWSHAPIYLGPILLFLACWPMLRRLQSLGYRHRVTSIADYLGARFGKRQSLSILVTLVAVAAVLPYIALQFRALTQAWTIIVGNSDDTGFRSADAALAMAMVLAAFTMLFGARRLDARERHQGLMHAMALESVVKLVAFFCVAAGAMFYLLDPPVRAAVDWSSQAPTRVELSADFYTRVLISACAVFCLPRQFHVMVVEATSSSGRELSRWLIPVYLALFMLLAVPISLAGVTLFSAPDMAFVSPDTYVQWVPAVLGQDWISIIAFIGGLSAATGMVIVATVSLAIMLTNEIAVPLMVRHKSEAGLALLSLGDRVRSIRQVTIVLILAAAWLVSQQLYGIPWLTEIGFISFLAAAQLAPGILAGLYWRQANGAAVTAGLVAGIVLWFVCLVLPSVLSPDSPLLQHGPLGLSWLRPQALLGWEGPGPLTYAALWSLGANTLLLLGVSRLRRTSVVDMRQAQVFLDAPEASAADPGSDFELTPVRAGQLRALLPPFLDNSRLQQLWRSFEERYQQRLLAADRIPVFALREAESVLAGVIGAASAARVINELRSSRQVDFSGLASLVTDAGRQQSFNRELLEATIESMLQGVSVVDSELRLMAWNSRYEEMFAYPERLLYVGMPVARLYRYNVERGVIGLKTLSVDAEVEKRLVWLRQGNPYRFERTLPDGRTIEIRGEPMLLGGFVTTYSDVTEYREMLTQLEETRLELEGRVASGSKSLADTNAELRSENRLRADAESKLREANLSKSRFMSATSHDLLQPINAARLFVAALRPELQGRGASAANLENIDRALGRAEGLIEDLREIARLDSGTQHPRIAPLAIDAVLRELYSDYAPAAARKGLTLRLRSSSLWIASDRQLLYRVLQNLLGNAIKYSLRGKVILGVRRRPGSLEIQVLDQGPGIAKADQARVFGEFERLGNGGSGEEEGLGLGLAIVSRYATLLKLPLHLHSEPGRGSVFSVSVVRTEPILESGHSIATPVMEGRLQGARVLCIDNDARVREGLVAMLTAEGCQVAVACDRHELRATLPGFRPDVIVADYHLDAGDTGIAALHWALRGADRKLPVIIVSADDGRSVREAAQRAGYRSLPKPINPARLTALIFALTNAGVMPAERAAVPPAG